MKGVCKMTGGIRDVEVLRVKRPVATAESVSGTTGIPMVMQARALHGVRAVMTAEPPADRVEMVVHGTDGGGVGTSPAGAVTT